MTERLLFRVDPSVFALFPDYLVACVVARNINPASHSSRLDDLMHNATVRARATFSDIDLKTVAPFAAWRDAFSTAGWSASRYPASVEALHKRIQRGDELPRINPVVDLANCAVLYYSVPVGTHDIASFHEYPLEVRAATTEDQFIAMNGEAEPPDNGEIVYVVDRDIRTRRWVWRQGRNALVSESSIDVFFPIDGFKHRTYDAVVAAQNYLAETLAVEFGARIDTGLVSSSDPEIWITD